METTAISRALDYLSILAVSLELAAFDIATTERQASMMFDLSPDDTVASRLLYWSVTSPETLAFVYVTPDGERFAYSRKELFSLSCRSATWLRQRGVGRQDVVLCLVSTSPEQTFVSLGASVLRATTICTMIQFKDGSDILPVMNLGDVTDIVVDQTDGQAISALMNYIPMLSPGTVSCQAFPSLKTREHLSFLQSISNEKEADVADVSPDDVAIIFVTSGTTGQSKLVPKTHRQLFAVGLNGYEILPIAEVFCNASSFGWLSGYPHLYVGLGQTRVVPYIKGPRELSVGSVERRNVTSPLTLKRLLARHDLLQCDVTWHLRTFVFTVSVFRKEYARVLGNLTSEIRVAYGSTEVGFVTYKVYTAGANLLETRLLECHEVHDVAVISIPDNYFNNRPCVCVLQDPRPEAERVVPENVLRMSAEYFQGSFARLDKQREAAAVPKVCLVFDKFPVNLNGKVQRKVFQSQALERLGLSK